MYDQMNPFMMYQNMLMRPGMGGHPGQAIAGSAKNIDVRDKKDRKKSGRGDRKSSEKRDRE